MPTGGEAEFDGPEWWARFRFAHPTAASDGSHQLRRFHRDRVTDADLAIPQALQRRLGHGDCGIYAEVTTGGNIAVGDALMAEQPELL